MLPITQLGLVFLFGGLLGFTLGLFIGTGIPDGNYPDDEGGWTDLEGRE